MLLIGIAGGTGSGKTTLADEIKKKYKDFVSIISYDNYYKDQGELPLVERDLVNYDCPDVIDTQLLISQLKQLKNDKEINMPVYNFRFHTREDCTIKISPASIIIVEGILLFHSKELRDLFDLKIFVDVSADVRILRRVERDISERGRTLNSVILQYLSTVQPMHDKYVEPTKKFSDLIINNSKNKNVISLLSALIEKEIKNSKKIKKGILS